MFETLQITWPKTACPRLHRNRPNQLPPGCICLISGMDASGKNFWNPLTIWVEYRRPVSFRLDPASTELPMKNRYWLPNVAVNQTRAGFNSCRWLFAASAHSTS